MKFIILIGMLLLDLYILIIGAPANMPLIMAMLFVTILIYLDQQENDKPKSRRIKR